MPKSSSPKKSKSPSKKSPGKKSSPKKSPKKGSPKVKSSNAVPKVDCCVATEESAVCYLCMRIFKDFAAVQAHLVLMNHMEPFDCKEQQCRACKTIVNIKDVERHQCAIMKANFLRLMSCAVILDFGPPYRCLFCRSNSYGSRVGLAMHLLCYHQHNKPPGRCGMCTFTYDEPPQRPPPNVPPLPPNADEEKKKQHALDLKAAKEKQLCELQDVSAPGLESLNLHVNNEHVPAYMLWSRQQIIEDSSLRFPYACPLCNTPQQSNYEFHAHIIACHGNKTQIENDLKVCSMCQFTAANDAGLKQHVLVYHTGPIKKLGSLWIRKELLMNVTDPGTTCIYCWQAFRYDFQLQAHLLVAHVTNHALRCGWCKVGFTSCADPILAFMIMQHHEYNHSLELQQVALKYGYTVVPVPEPLPEIPDKEALVTARLNRAGVRSASPKGKKHSPKGKKSKSPKSKSKSPKSKSPKSSSKSKK